MAETKVFIAGLQPREQNALRLLLNNYLKIQMKILLNRFVAEPTERDAGKMWRRLRNMMDVYESMTGSYPTRELVPHTKGKLMFFDAMTMRYICEAIRLWSPEPTENTLDEDNIRFVQEHIAKLDKVLKQSALFEFTIEEIKRIRSSMS